jgi:purine-binding chemotaxis protein CheW
VTESDASPGGTVPGAAPVQGRLLLFHAGGRTFAVPAQKVREVVPFGRPVRLPGAPSHVLGIVNLRGTVVTVIDLARRLGLDVVQSDSRCIVLLNRGSRPVGLAVDGVRDVIIADDTLIEESREGQSLSELATGILRLGDELVLLLDLDLLVKQVLLS